MEDEIREEFDVEDNERATVNKEVAIQKMKEFSYYLTENVEDNLNLCLKLLEARALPKKSNSDPVTAVGLLATPIPYVGKGISSALQEGETYILGKIDQKNSRTLAGLVYYFSDNAESIRQMLIESSADVFYSFENQFLKLNCGGGSRRAMHKLAKDAANRIFTYLLKTKRGEDVCKDDFSRGVVHGGSIKNKVGMKSGKSVTSGEQKWKTSDIYTKVGLFIEESDEFFENKETESEVYGYRRVFDWENVDEIRKDWLSDSPSPRPIYTLTKEDLTALYPEIGEYIMSKNAEEESKLDRQKKHEESMEDQQSKHEEIMKTFMEKFHDVLADLTRNYAEISVARQQTETLITTIKENQTIEVERHQELSEKLTVIHRDVLETRDGQVQLHQTTDEIKHEICTIKSNQEEISSATSEVKKAVEEVSNQKQPSLSDLVQDNYEVKKVTKIVNEAKDAIRGHKLESKVRNEIKRTFRKIKL